MKKNQEEKEGKHKEKEIKDKEEEEEEEEEKEKEKEKEKEREKEEDSKWYGQEKTGRAGKKERQRRQALKDIWVRALGQSSEWLKVQMTPKRGGRVSKLDMARSTE